MKDKRFKYLDGIQNGLTGLMILGIGITRIGLVIEPISPYSSLDRVLSSKELQGDVKREATLPLLQRAEGNRPDFWMARGMMRVAVSAVGYRYSVLLERELGPSRIDSIKP